MSNFNYEKAWFLFAKPAFKTLSKKQKDVLFKVAGLIGGLNQGKDLDIPLTPEITELLESLDCSELAPLARASHAVGHWLPGHVKPLFDNKRGESWKVVNAIDQVLRTRLFDGKTKAYRTEIHDGIFRVSFSNTHCWLWEEVGLATEKNLLEIEGIGLNYDEENFKEHADTIKAAIGDLWNTDKIDSMPSDTDYLNYLILKVGRAVEKEKQSCVDEIETLRQKPKEVQYESDCKIEVLEKGLSTSNLIYYTHTKEWVLGWREPVTQKQSESWRSADLSFDVRMKLADGTAR